VYRIGFTGSSATGWTSKYNTGVTLGTTMMDLNAPSATLPDPFPTETDLTWIFPVRMWIE